MQDICMNILMVSNATLMQKAYIRMISHKGRTINDFGGGARAKAGEKNSMATRAGKKKLNSTTPKFNG